MTPSAQVAAAHKVVVLSQTASAQSSPLVHMAPTPQGAQSGPPQSTSVSWALSWLSVQPGATQRPEVSSQTPLVQSESTKQVLWLGQAGQLEPQSTSVSPPFMMVSSQAGAAQWWSVQTPLWQSLEESHFPPSPQGPQEPPQSTSVSSPLRVASLQLAAAQTPSPQ